MDDVPDLASLLLRYTANPLHYMYEVIVCPKFLQHGELGRNALGFAPVCMYVCMCMYVFVYVCISVCVYVRMYVCMQGESRVGGGV